MTSQITPPLENEHFDLDEFLSWASHDLKTPLNAVIGFSRIIMKGIDGPVSELQVTDLNSVYTSGQRMLTLISQVVEIARLNRGETRLNREATQMAPLLEEISAAWKEQNQQWAFQATLALPTEFSLTVDPVHMRTVVTGLLTFAAIQIADGGQVSLNADVSAAGLALSLRARGGRTKADVKMDSTLLRHISASLLKLNDGLLETCQVEEGEVNLRAVMRTS